MRIETIRFAHYELESQGSIPDSPPSPLPESGQQMGQIIRDRRRECDSDCAMTYGRAGADDIVETLAAHRFAPM